MMEPKKDCPLCYGMGGYTVTNCDDEEPIQCDCNIYNEEEWAKIKKFYLQNEFPSDNEWSEIMGIK